MDWSHIFTVANLLGLIGGIFYIASTQMKTIVPLRSAGIASNFFLLCYGLLSASYLTFALYITLLPINSVRLYQMLKLIKRVRAASQGDLSMDWLKPFMTKRDYRNGDVLFRKGDRADEMFFTVTGKFLVKEINIDLPPGQIVGEMGFLTPENRRTQTVECVESGQVLTISYDKVRELYFQNPTFGFYFLRLTSERLLANNARLEKLLEERKA
ncbi:MAG: cyclic nucleotide-binding domain-containing protein [Rhizobiales bacterium]|nr:cyclic nucleotide-binding domain-containing protein [Hyphomicrobiales bacterium]